MIDQNSNMNDESKSNQNYLVCIDCRYSIAEESFQDSELFCPKCGGHLEPSHYAAIDQTGQTILDDTDDIQFNSYSHSSPKLIVCPTCMHDLSINASTCPNCGEPLTKDLIEKGIKKAKESVTENKYRPLDTSKNKMNSLHILLVVIIVGLGLFAFFRLSANQGRGTIYDDPDNARSPQGSTKPIISEELNKAYYDRYSNNAVEEYAVAFKLDMCDLGGCTRYEYEEYKQKKEDMIEKCNDLKVELLEKYGALPNWFKKCPFDSE